MVGIGLIGTLLGPLDYMFGETLRVAVVVAVVLAVVCAVLARFNEWSFELAARHWLLITSLAAIYLFTQHSPYRGHGHILDLSPFSDVRAARHSSHRRDLLLANVALFVPLGVALAWRGMGLRRTLAWGLGLSVAAETMQYLAGHGRIAQVDDVVCNTAGAVIGWMVAAAALWVLERQRRVASEVQRRAGQHAGGDSDDDRDSERDRDCAGRT